MVLIQFFCSNSVPDDVYIGSLRQQHVNEINNLWFFKSADSAEHIRSLILLNGGIGVFDKATDELLSWVILTEYFNPGYLLFIHIYHTYISLSILSYI